jgi:ankyrin repeat protein
MAEENAAFLRAEVARLESELASSRRTVAKLKSELQGSSARKSRAAIGLGLSDDARNEHLVFSRSAWSEVFRDTVARLPFALEDRVAMLSGVTVVKLKRECGEKYSDEDARMLLKKDHFNPENVRQGTSGSQRQGGEWERDFPMFFYSADGDVEMCRWLFENGAADDVSKISVHEGFTPMLIACQKGHLLVCKWLFEVGAAADITKADSIGYTPMFMACRNGHLPICQWLSEVGSPEILRKPNHHGLTPMLQACFKGHLQICQWLFEAGAAKDISEADPNGYTPMFVACSSGHLSIAQWLFEVGAAKDITRAAKNGSTPLRNACRKSHLSTCQWMILKGALTDASDKIDPTALENDIRNDGLRSTLLAWAQCVVAANKTFRNTVLRGTLQPDVAPTVTLLRRAYIKSGLPEAAADATIAALPEEQRAAVLQQLHPNNSGKVSALVSLSGCAGVLELVADFVGGIHRGRDLRNARLFAEFVRDLD